MPRKYNKNNVGKRAYNTCFSTILLKECMDAINEGMSIRQASKRFSIPRSTLHNKMKSKHKKCIGAPTVFTYDEEQLFTSRIKVMCDWGFPLDKLDVKMLVAAYLQSQNRTVKIFKNNVPGDDWVSSFMKRSQLTHRIASNIKRKRAAINKEQLKIYFDNIKLELEGIPPCNIWNYDETNLRDDPGNKKVVMKRGTKYPERIMNSSKVCFSVMFCGNGVGEILPPYTVFKSTHLYDSWVKHGPKNSRFNRTQSGWFDEITFEDWFFRTLLPCVKKQSGKKVIIGDNLSSHLSHKVVNSCEKNNIAFICLLPNSTHLLQPLDVAFFAPLKKAWRSILLDWKLTSRGKKFATLPKEDFSKLLNDLMTSINKCSRENLISGFRACGLVPFNPNAVYIKLPSENVLSPRKALDQSLLDILSEKKNECGDKKDVTQSNNKNKKQISKKRLKVEPGKSISVECDSETETASEGESDYFEFMIEY